MKLLEELNNIWKNVNYPFIIHKENSLNFSDISSSNLINLSSIKKGSVVALIGDFNPFSIITFLRLIDLGAIVLPLTIETLPQHKYFFESAFVDVVISENSITKYQHNKKHNLIEKLRNIGNPGLIVFTTGTTDKPKAILHDFTSFIKWFRIPHSSFKTINFLMFDHIGGINILLHTLFHKGIIITPETRTVNSILNICKKHNVEVLPTTPTFLRMMLMSGIVPDGIPECIKIITYGAEQMDQFTLNELCKLLPDIDFRQTFGMSELGAVRVKSEHRNSLFMKLGGKGVETKIVDNILHIRSAYQMLGYLNAPSPFDKNGWFNTKDIVEVKNEFIKIVGRTDDVINVGGLKFKKSEIENVVLSFPDVLFAKLISKQNPITRQHIELIVQPVKNKSIDKKKLTFFLKKNLQSHMMPKRIKIEDINISHRFKKL